MFPGGYTPRAAEISQWLQKDTVILVMGAGLFALAIFAYDRMDLGAAWPETSTFELLVTRQETPARGGHRPHDASGEGDLVRAVWWVLYVGGQVGTQQLNLAEAIVNVTAPTTAPYPMVYRNAGMAYRHRAQIVVFFLPLMAVGLDVWKRKRAHHRSSRGPAA